MNWLINEVITEKDDPLLTTYDHRLNQLPLSRLVVSQPFTELIGNGLSKMSNKNILSLLTHRNYYGRYWLKNCIPQLSHIIVEKLNNIFISRR